MIERETLSVHKRISVKLSPTKDEIETYNILRKPIENIWHPTK